MSRLLEGDGEIDRVNSQPLSEAQHQLDGKCSGCAYNESCSTAAFEQQHVRLLGLTPSEQTLLESHGITTVGELADLCAEPREWEWDPTSQKTAGFARQTYRALKGTPGFGEKLPNIVYRAQAIQKQLSDTDEDTFPAAWVPGTGRCELPEDNPPEDFEFEYERGSMIRVYLNIQEDHLRDRVIQLSARVTATASDTEPQRVSALSSTAPTGEEESLKAEEDLLKEFSSKLYSAIQSVTDGLSVDLTDQQHPLLHIYTYTPSEQTQLVEACKRANAPQIDAFRNLLEGNPGADKLRVSHLKPEVKSRVSIASPSYGLMHAYDELQPPSEDYSKSRSFDEWSYTPAYTQTKSEVDLRKVFNRRLFNVTVDWEMENGDLRVDPTEHEQLNGLKTRFRHGAEIPLGYHWAAIGRIDEQWKADLDVDTSSSVVQYEIDSYLYHDASDKTQQVTPTDVETVGKHLCDVLEHVERSLIYRDKTLAENKTPVDATTLTHDDHTPLTIGEASRDYLWMEHTTRQREIYELYRDLPSQRILTGESLPVEVDEVDEDKGNSLCVTVKGYLRYDELFGDHARAVKRVCKQKGDEGTSSGDWMVANPLDPGRTDQTISEPYEVEAGVNASIKKIDMRAGTIEFELRNEYWEPGQFDSFHRNYTTDKDRADQDNYTYIAPGESLILDPLTDNLTADRADKALANIESNALHELLEELRYGANNPDALRDTTFDRDTLETFTEWIEDTIPPETYPNENQQEFIESDDQVTLLQGPPGTGKTAGTLSPGLLARVHAAEKAGESVNGLITAPSNTAIDEVLEDTSKLLDTISGEDNAPVDPEKVDIIRLTGNEPAIKQSQAEYLDYNNDEDAPRLQKIHNNLTGVTESLSETGSSTTPQEETEPTQQTFGAFTEADTDDSHADKSGGDGNTHTLIFATPTKAWGLLKHFSADDADPNEIADQSHWNLLAIDEASMLTTPKLILAGVGMRREAQLLVSGDHRQLPPVQKHDWGDETRRSTTEAAPFLSALDYFRLLGGDKTVLPEEAADSYRSDIDADANEIPMVKLDTTYRFGPDTAEFIRSTVYEEDGIDYSSGVDPNDIQTQHTATTTPLQTAFEGGEVTLITYDSETTYQQVNVLEATIAQALLQNHHPDATAGLVTPHNAQRSRLREMLQNLEADADVTTNIELGETTFVETVERFQGGENDLMIVSATATDPQYIRAENEFLLEQNRANVSFTRHKNKLIVIAAESLLSHIPADTTIYDEALLWKELPAAVGEPPTDSTTPDWSGSLKEFITPMDAPGFLSADETSISVYDL